MKTNTMIECACGCGNKLAQYDSRGRVRKFLPGHWPRIQPNTFEVVLCSNCGQEIKRPRWHRKLSTNHFCNAKCSGQWATKTGFFQGENNGHYNTITVPCAGCEKPVSKAASLIERRNGRVYCPDCVLASRSGPNEKYPPEFTPSLRRQIRKRDDYTCQICHTRPNHTLHVHHIDCNKQNNHEMNLVALCRACHGLTILAVEKWKMTLSSQMAERFSHPSSVPQPVEQSVFLE